MKLAATLVAAGVLALLSLAHLVGIAYATLAERQLDQPAAASTLAAARIAARWTPWSGEHAALEGWILAENGAAEATAVYERALRLAPADPLLWTEYALARARLGRFDEPLLRAVTQARRLAPTSPVVRRTTAELGLSYWQRGSAGLRAAWLEAMREELAVGRKAFLEHVLLRGQGRAFCADAGPRLDEQAWCDAVTEAIAAGCFEPTRTGLVPCRPR